MRCAVQEVAAAFVRSVLARRGSTPPPTRVLAFRLIQRVRGVPGADEAIAADEGILDPALEDIARQLDVLGQRGESFGIDVDELRDSMMAQWDTVEAKGTALDRAAEDARHRAVELLGAWARRSDRFRWFVGIVDSLATFQADRGVELIALPRDEVGRVLQCAPERVTDFVQLGEGGGLLHRARDAVCDHGYPSCKRCGWAFHYRVDRTCPLYNRPGAPDDEE